MSQDINNHFSEQLQSIKELKEAQDALTFDPNSVMREGQIIDFREKHDAEYQKLMNIQNKLFKINAKIDKHTKETEDTIQNYQKALSNNEMLFRKYNNDIRKKKELVATRDRMLQLSQERNVYKQKMIYVLLSIIITLVVIVIAIYSFFNK